MNFFEYIKTTGLKRAFQIDGRATRREIWYWFIFTNVVQSFLMLTAASVGYKTDLHFTTELTVLVALVILFPLITLIPTLTLYIRRLHDFNFCGWFILIGLLPGGSTYFSFIDGWGYFSSLFPGFGFIALWIILFLKESTRGENDYGPEEEYE